MTGRADPGRGSIDDLDLHAFVDGVLEEDRRNELLAHLASQPAEAERVSAFFRQKAMLAELSDRLATDDDADFCPELQRGLARAVRRQTAVHRLKLVAAGLVVLLPVTLAGWSLYQHQLTSSEQALGAGMAASDTFSPEFPFGADLAMVEGDEFGSDGDATPALLSHHFSDQALTVPDLEGLGFRLIGGDTLTGEALAARLVYEDDGGHRLLVYVALVASDAAQAMSLVPEGHIALHLRRGPFVFAVIGRAESPRLLDVVRLVSEEMTGDRASAPQMNRETITAAEQPTSVSPIQPVGLPGNGAGKGSSLESGVSLPATPDVGAPTLTPIPVAPVPAQPTEQKIL